MRRPEAKPLGPAPAFGLGGGLGFDSGLGLDSGLGGLAGLGGMGCLGPASGEKKYRCRGQRCGDKGTVCILFHDVKLVLALINLLRQVR